MPPKHTKPGGRRQDEHEQDRADRWSCHCGRRAGLLARQNQEPGEVAKRRLEIACWDRGVWYVGGLADPGGSPGPELAQDLAACRVALEKARPRGDAARLHRHLCRCLVDRYRPLWETAPPLAPGVFPRVLDHAIAAGTWADPEADWGHPVTLQEDAYRPDIVRLKKQLLKREGERWLDRAEEALSTLLGREASAYASWRLFELLRRRPPGANLRRGAPTHWAWWGALYRWYWEWCAYHERERLSLVPWRFLTEWKWDSVAPELRTVLTRDLAWFEALAPNNRHERLSDARLTVFKPDPRYPLEAALTNSDQN